MLSQLTLERALTSLLSDYVQRHLRVPAKARVSILGLVASIVIDRAPDPLSNGHPPMEHETDCEFDILEWFDACVPAGERRLAADVAHSMHERGNGHTTSVIFKCLMRLRKAGELKNDRTKLGFWR